MIYDAEHFFDGYTDNPEYALSTLEGAQRGGADFLTLLRQMGETGNSFHQITQTVVDHFPDSKLGYTATMMPELAAVSLAGWKLVL